jgi:hypothetical protein
MDEYVDLTFGCKRIFDVIRIIHPNISLWGKFWIQNKPQAWKIYILMPTKTEKHSQMPDKHTTSTCVLLFCYSSLDVYKFNVRFGNNKQQNSQESMKTKKQPVR